ncbi:helix-turn-helix domain-containing protein [Allomeiothermus silvanus]|uniref:helix-turn-helix domain-containing protein n=1 Tax=Allomeiothermus silvanus TaxID=52022 RepID=UPI0023F568E9|nr:helix-turn-helix domain-containing protein [Allomeiothermus silvanus]
MTLGERLRTMRKEKGLSLRRASEEAGISVAYLSRLEGDDANPTLEVLERLAKLYGVPLEELTAGTRETSRPLQLVPALVEFLKAYEDSFPELKDPDWRRTLSNIRLRGRYPEKKEDWLSLFLELRRALK